MVNKNKIREIIKKSGLEIEPSDEDFEKLFVEIGLDSLDVFGFLSEIEIVLGNSFSEEDYSKLKTLNDVISFLNN